MAFIRLLMLIMLLASNAFAGRLMDTDFASEAELNSRGASKAQLLNTSKIYDTTRDDTLNNILDQGNAVTDDLYDLVGVPVGDTDLGSFTGTTIPDGSNAKAALQALETSGESLSDDVSILDSEAVKITGDQTIDGVKTFSGKIKSTSTANGNSPCPSMTQAQIDVLTSEEVGDCVFNTTTGNLNVFDGTLWKSAGGGLSMWASGKVFNLNDVAVYDNAIYKCISAHTSIASFEPANWQLISGDTILNDIQAKKIEADKVIQTANNTLKIETDSDNLLVNGGFEAQDVTLGWTKSVNTSIDFIDTNAFEGKKSRAIRFGGTVANYRAEANRPEYVGRQARVEIYYKSDITWGANVPDICVYAGTSSNIVSGTCEPLQNTGTQWYPYQKGFFWSEAVMGLVIRNNGAVDLLNYVYLDKASIKLDKNEGFVANIEGDYQAEILSTNSTILTSTDLNSLSSSNARSNATIYTKSSQGITFLRDGDIRITASSVTGNITPGTEIYLNGTGVSAAQLATTNSIANTVSWSFPTKKGDKITVFSAYNNTGYNRISIYATARSQVTVFPDETFSTDINPVYWKATACGENEIGCYNTYSYAVNTNTGTLCGSRPTTQSDSEMKGQGVRIYSSSYASGSNCNSPTDFYFTIGKGMSNPSLTIFKDTVKSVSGVIDSIAASSEASGLFVNSYDPLTGKLRVSAKSIYGLTTSVYFRFEDNSIQNNGYLVIKASKTGLGMANVPARYVVKTYQSGTYWYEVCNDGWVRQGDYKEAGSGLVTVNYGIPMKDTAYSVVMTGYSTSTSNVAFADVGYTTGNTTSLSFYMSDSAPYRRIWRVEGYGASSVVKQYGANPAY